MSETRRRGGRRGPSGLLAVREYGLGRRTTAMARFMIFFTVIGWGLYLADLGAKWRTARFDATMMVEAGLSIILFTSLTASACAYLLARLGYFERLRTHRRTPRATIDDDFDIDQPTITVLVPAYREEANVIRQTLLSAALQEYPGVRIVLLIDDPPDSPDAKEKSLLEEARDIPGELMSLLEPHYARSKAALDAFDQRYTEPGAMTVEDLNTLCGCYLEASAWLDLMAGDFRNDADADHADRFLADEVLNRLGSDLSDTAVALSQAAADPTAQVSRHRARQLYRRLVWIFESEIWSFERKQFASLSHEANKAMNLNSYLSLMGRRYSIETCPGAQILVEQTESKSGLQVPDSDYIVTLDADSMLLPEYCIRLVHLLEQPQHSQVAVVQTPYSSYPEAPSALERIAGATTDIQHIVHQGLTRFDATFWVGANAVLRKSAIDDLRVDSDETGFTISKFIADRTVIEDTESSIDLRSLGWQLYNYPERLSYSATPPDFGSLVVQRKRWANGGLLVLGRLLKLRHSGTTGVSLTEVFLRLSYLASISWVSLGLTILLVYPLDQRLLSVFAVSSALPYFVSTASDLHRCGYRRRDVVGVYALNLLLLPVNLAGTLSSITQAISGHKVDFARTPKVKNRTSAPLLFVLAPFALLLWSAYSFARALDDGFVIRAVFAGTNTAALLYAFLAYIGPIGALVDVFAGLREKSRVRIPRSRPVADGAPVWASVLFLGSGDSAAPSQVDPVALALSARDHMLSNPAGPQAHPTPQFDVRSGPSHVGVVDLIDLRITSSPEPASEAPANTVSVMSRESEAPLLQGLDDLDANNSAGLSVSGYRGRANWQELVGTLKTAWPKKGNE